MKSIFQKCLITSLLLGFSIPTTADTFNTKRCINMGNALDAPNEGDWRHTIEAKSFERIAKAGFDTVRIPVRWSAHTGNAPNYIIDEKFFQRVSDVIQQALTHDLHVILNIHHFDELNAAPKENHTKFIALWSQIASRYQSLPDTVYFEIINEPTDNFKGDLMRQTVKAGFAKIRETNPTRILIMGGDNWSGLKSLPSIPKINDTNQVYTFHYYDPFKFTHQKTSWTHLKNSPTVTWASASDKKALEGAAQYAANIQKTTGIPVFLGEFGAYEKAPYKDIVSYTNATRKAFENVGISWCAWNYTATFPFYNTTENKWDLEKLEALGLSPNGIIKK